MGSEQSQMSGVEIEEKSVEVSDFWSQHVGSVMNSGNVTLISVLIGESYIDGTLWQTRTPLEIYSKNLMIYRHPCIVKYISSWQKSSKCYLATEELIPLNHILSTQNTYQICIGLHSILKALTFLHDRASVSHNNICVSSIYVSKEGNWKLGGMEYLCKSTTLTPDYLNKTKLNRYNKAVDPNEENHLQNTKRHDVIDVYAYGVLVSEVLKDKNNDEISSLTMFRDVCISYLQNSDITLRPKLCSLLEHDFFNHEFINIYSFLTELPLKSDDEKSFFFKTLHKRLNTFSEVTVLSLLGNLLLSRMVLLNKVAQDKLVPLILCPKSDSEECTEKLFSIENFKKYITPKLLEIFCVRDAQIRLLLLDYFPYYLPTFSKEELRLYILPELLVGIKDTNDRLVSVTLRTLADLIPILGAATVIGGKRAKLFNDGRPIIHSVRRLRKDNKTTDRTPSLPIQSNLTSMVELLHLPERPRPDGEEGETSTEEIEPSVEEDLDNWEDWDVNEPNSQDSHAFNQNPTVTRESPVALNSYVVNTESQIVTNHSLNENLKNSDALSKQIQSDILKLDIKSQTDDPINQEEIDFFEDMVPVIEASPQYAIDDNDIKANATSTLNSKINLNIIGDLNEDGWDNEWE